MIQISKSDYMLFLKHPAWLWLKKHDKNKLPPTSPSLQVIFDEGHLFEKYAEKLFSDSIKLGFNNYDEYLTLPKRTSEALINGAKTILQGRFEFESLTCIVDALEKVDDGQFDLYEIKSSTSVKPEHIDDLAFQLLVLEGTGLKIRHTAVIYVNNEYMRKGEIDVKGISVVTDVTDDVKDKITQTRANLLDLFKVLESSTQPDLSPRYTTGRLSDWMDVYKFIHQDLDKFSIYNLCRLSPSLIGELEDIDVKLIQDIPSNIKLATKQQGQVEATKLDGQIIDKKRIKEFIDQIKYPLYFLDYETMSGVIPTFDGTKPYQQLPFQYSLYVIDSPGADAKHLEYLHRENTFPCLPMLKRLKEDIGTEGTIFVWHESFEKSRNTELGELFPEYADFMASVNDRIIDLKTPFSKDWFVDKNFFGSASIKDVMPALVTDLSYKELLIHEGNAAQRVWMETVLEGKNSEKRDEIMNALIEYCKLDTLAMVRLYEVLQNKVIDD